MNLFKRLFAGTVAVKPKTATEEEIRQLHLAATQSIKQNQFETAVQLLEKAQKLMPTVATEYPVAQYLRLPITLQQAGDFSRANEEFNRLLKFFSKPYHKSHIYDKLRVTHQREGLHQQAVEFGILCCAWECIALNEQKRAGAIFIEDTQLWTKQIKKSLKAIGKESEEQIITNKCMAFAQQPSGLAADRLVLDIRNELRI